MFTSFLTLANYRQIKIARTILLNKAFLCSCLSCKQIKSKPRMGCISYSVELLSGQVA